MRARALLASGAAAVTAAACAVASISHSAEAGRADGFSSISNTGVAIALDRLTPTQRRVVENAGFAEIRRLSRMNAIKNGPYVGRWYWYVGSVAGRTCFARGFVEEGRAEFSSGATLNPFGCRGASRPRGFVSLGGFPSRKRPVADASAYGAWSPGDRSVRIAVLCGLAADAVKVVGIARPDGTLLISPVRGNTYCVTRIGRTLLARTQANAIVGLDASGRRVYRKQVEGPPATRRRTPLRVTFLTRLSAARATTALGQGVLWPGTSVARIPLYEIQLLRVAGRSERGSVTYRRALHFRYFDSDRKPPARVTLANRPPWINVEVGTSPAHTPLAQPFPAGLKPGVLSVRRDRRLPLLWIGRLWKQEQPGKRPLFFVFSSSHRYLVTAAARALRRL